MSTSTSSIERARVKLPDGFDPARHEAAMCKKVSESTGKEGWRLSSVDGEHGIFIRHSAVTTVTKKADSFDVKLPGGTKPADGDKLAASLADTYSDYGVVMTRFEPFLGKATLSKMTDDALRCRGAVSTAIGVKPWDVQVAPTSDGGFSLELPKTYVSSKHYDKLVEVATDVVGTVGWRVKVNPQTLTAQFIPGDPPLFPKAIPAPIKTLGKGDVQKTPLGVTLPEEGEGVGPVETIDWSASAWGLVAGTPGSGKRQPLHSRIPVPLSERFPDGWATMGELEIGDTVFSGRGRPVTVDYISETVTGPTYRVHFEDGQVVEADAEHLWTVSTFESRQAHAPQRLTARAAAKERRTARVQAIREAAARACQDAVGATAAVLQETFSISRETVYAVAGAYGVPRTKVNGLNVYVVDEFAVALASRIENKYGPAAHEFTPEFTTVTTEELARGLHVPGRANKTHNFAVALPDAIELPEADLPLDPYLFGAWLGDGTSRKGAITVGEQDLEFSQAEYERAWGTPVHRADARDQDGTLVLHFGRPNPDRCKRNHDLGWWTYADGRRICKGCGNFPTTPFGENCSLTEVLYYLGVQQNKHIPAMYLRASVDQRLALLQGLMDTDGWVNRQNQQSGFCSADETLARQTLELVRSLGIRARMKWSPTNYTVEGPDGSRVRRPGKGAWKVTFKTTLPVFRMPRKRALLPTELTTYSRWNHIVRVERIADTAGRCIRVNDPEHTYLTEDFVPTHNTVLLNWLIAQQIADGASVCVIDEESKSLDFAWAKPFLREHGWGCDSEAHAVTALALIYEEGKRRAKVLAEMGIPNWLNVPAKDRFQPIFVVVDELSALTVMDPVPKGVPKDHPIVMEINQMNFLRALISRFINKIIAEQRFVGIRMVLSTQVTNASTGLPPSLKNKIGHRVLAGSNPSKPARNQAFNDESGVVEVPEHVKSSGAHARGVGVADLEGHASVVYKSFYADEKDYAKRLTELGVPTNKKPSPTDAQVAEHAPDLSESEEAGVPDRAEAPRGDLPPSGKPLPADSPFGPGQAPTGADGKPLRGAAAAAKALKTPAAPSGPGPICPACDEPIDPSTDDCGCRW